MRFLFLVLLCAVGTDLFAAKLVNYTRRGNKIALQLSEGSGEFEWASPSTFRIRRSLRSEPPSSTPLSTDAISFTDANSAGALKLDSEFLHVEIDKSTLQVKIRTSNGLMLLSESAPLARKGGALTLEWDKAANEKIYGGPATGVKPFFISSRGYGLGVSTLSVIRFDLGQPNHITASSAMAETLEYFFHYGPSIKEIFEERIKALPAYDPPELAELGSVKNLPRQATVLPPLSPCELAPALVNASLSARYQPAFDVAAYPTDSPEYKRALQIAAVSPVFLQSAGTPPAASVAARDRFRPFLVTYFDETRTRGFPILHPLQMQFPRDLEAGTHTDEFMFGDEMLVAPACTSDGKRPVYLPQGIWTYLRTGEVFTGRKTVNIEHPANDPLPPIFARNGTIVPFGPPGKNGTTELHYFPKLGGEFFFYEPDVAEYSQVHASPSTDLYRVEIESKVDRLYEWVLHHIEPVREVTQVLPTNKFEKVSDKALLKPGAWWYDAPAKSLHIRVFAPKGADVIVNAVF